MAALVLATAFVLLATAVGATAVSPAGPQTLSVRRAALYTHDRTSHQTARDRTRADTVLSPVTR